MKNKSKHRLYDAMYIVGYTIVILGLAAAAFLFSATPVQYLAGALCCVGAILGALLSGLSMYFDSLLTSKQIKGETPW